MQAQIIGSMPDINTESRIEAGVIYKFNKKLNITNKTQLRFSTSSQYFDQYNYDVNIGYKLNKFFKIKLGGRFIGTKTNNYGEKYIEKHFRTDYSVSQQFKVSRLTISNRIRYHDYYNLSHRPKYDKKIQISIRLKSQIKFNFRNWKLDPHLYGEYFYRTASGDRKPHNKFRIGFGTNYKTKQIGTISLRYIFESEIKSWNPKQTNIIDIAYKYTIKRKSQ